MRSAARNFFDRAAVIDAMDKASLRALSRFGAFVRRSAKSLIRKRRAVSQPGSPPSSHTGLLKQFLFFFWDPETRSVVVGPIKLNQKSGEAPSLLEYGGKINAREQRITVKKEGSTRQVVIPAGTRTYSARPYMQPALDANLSKLPDMWSNAIKST